MSSDIDPGVSFQTPADSPEENLARLAKEAKYVKIDMFRRVLATLLQVPKSNTATELVRIFQTYIQDNAKILKERSMGEVDLDISNATSLLKHITECDDCRNWQEICPVLEDCRQNATIFNHAETESEDEDLVESQVGILALKQLVFPVQRNPNEDL